MAVFTSGGISKENIRNLISGDIQFTHPNPIVHDSIFCYQTTIHYLLNNSMRENRAQEAFDIALKEAETFQSNNFDASQFQVRMSKIKSFKIIDWLKLAQ